MNSNSYFLIKAVRGSKGWSTGIHFFEVTFTEPLHGTSIMIGLGGEETQLHFGDYEYINLIGYDQHSWGLSHMGTIWHSSKSLDYCEPFKEQMTRIGVLVNFFERTIIFFKNDKSLGIAFKLPIGIGALYPIVSSTATNIKLNLTKQYSILTNLQEICCETIRKNYNKHEMDTLPLPKKLINYLKLV